MWLVLLVEPSCFKDPFFSGLAQFGIIAIVGYPHPSSQDNWPFRRLFSLPATCHRDCSAVVVYVLVVED